MPTSKEKIVAAIHLDAVGGVAGDMFSAALLDARPALWSVCSQAIDALRLPDGVKVEAVPGTDSGFAGTRFKVHVRSPERAKAAPHVHWAEILKLLQNAALDASVRKEAISIFNLLVDKLLSKFS